MLLFNNNKGKNIQFKLILVEYWDSLKDVLKVYNYIIKIIILCLKRRVYERGSTRVQIFFLYKFKGNKYPAKFRLIFLHNFSGLGLLQFSYDMKQKVRNFPPVKYANHYI